MSDVTILDNTDCGTSRNALALIRHAGIESRAIEYLKTSPSKDRLRGLVAMMQIPVRTLLRGKGMPYGELQLDDPNWSDRELLDFRMQHPIVIDQGQRIQSRDDVRAGV